MELLSPAGSELSLIAAVQSGADAVYLGGNKFSARHSAKNFSIDDMKRQIEYCHLRGTDVHVAANILIKENERNEFIDYIGRINEIGADALIIQDIGMAHEVRKCFPDLPLHASTQMTAASLDAVKHLEKMGFSRVVLSRELSKDEIKYIKDNSDVEIEVFVHGALCMSYSGQCLMSSIIGGRSGNRGRCAQPCRLSYDLMDKNSVIKSGYLLSPKDNSLLDELKSLNDIGVSSLKIEGRLKRPEYVAAVTGVYRNLLDTLKSPSKEDWKIISDAFNRSGFTNGYYLGKVNKDMMSINTPGNVSENIFSADAEKRCKEDANFKRIPVDIYAVLKKGQPMEITMLDDDFNTVTLKGEIKVEKADNKPLTKERIDEQIKKLGNTPFSARRVEIIADDDIVIPISEINNMRRKAVSELTESRIKVKKRRSFSTFIKNHKMAEQHNKFFSAEVRTIEQGEVVSNSDIPLIYAPSEIARKIKEKHPEKTVITVLPPVWRKKNDVQYYIADGVSVSNIGELEAFSDYDCYGGFRLNVFNNNSIKYFENLKSILISPELNIKEIRGLIENQPLEMLVYGRLPLMVMENCPVKAHLGCRKEAYLKDRRNEKFPLSCGVGCYCEILNSKPIYMADKWEDIKKLPISIYKLNFTTESKNECTNIIDSYKKAFNGVENVEKMQENTFTRGHYYRGVE